MALIIIKNFGQNPTYVSGGSGDRMGIQRIRYFGTPGPTTLDKGSLTLGRSLDVPRISRYDVDTETPRPEKLLVDFDTTVNSSPTDISGQGNHGTFYGDAQYSAADKAFVFDGTGDYIKAAGIGNASGVWEHSVSLWFRLENIAQSQALWYIDGDSSGTSYNTPHVVVGTDGRIRFDMWSSSVYSPDDTITGGIWYHVVTSLSATNNTKCVYVNGTLVATHTTSDTHVVDANASLWIGSYGDGSAPMTGKISNFKVYNTVLEPSEVQKLYRLGRTGRSMVISDTAVGIGKAPEAQLDVRGLIKGMNATTSIAAWSVAKSTYIANVSAATTIEWDDVQYNIGGCYSNPNFTAPVSGYYYHSFHIITRNDSNSTYVGYYINDTDVDTDADFGAYDSSATGYRNIAGSWILYLNAGDRLKLVLKDGSMNSNLNRWSGFFLSS